MPIAALKWSKKRSGFNGKPIFKQPQTSAEPQIDSSHIFACRDSNSCLMHRGFQVCLTLVIQLEQVRPTWQDRWLQQSVKVNAHKRMHLVQFSFNEWTLSKGRR